MAGSGSKKRCRELRVRLSKSVGARIRRRVGWIEDHVASCPRCQRRLAGLGRVNLALAVLKNQPHGLELLGRANAQAIGRLKNSVRDVPAAESLRRALPRLSWWGRWHGYVQRVGNLAACLVILLLMKVGVFSSMETLQDEGQRVVREHYEEGLGEELTRDLFGC